MLIIPVGRAVSVGRRASDPRAGTTDPLHRQLARLLVLGFNESSPAWPTLEAGLQTVIEVLHDGFVRAAVDDSDADKTPPAGSLPRPRKVLGWVGGILAYSGRVCELHPLVVDPAHRGTGIGRALVDAFEAEARTRGALTAWVGADDEIRGTSLGEVDLYEDLPTRLSTARVIDRHPLGFYRKLGYTLAGVLPDANGRGKPDLFLAKRL